MTALDHVDGANQKDEISGKCFMFPSVVIPSCRDSLLFV